MFKYKSVPLCLLAASLLASPVVGLAGDDTSKDKPAPATAPVTPLISGDFGISVISSYISRGLVLNNEGAISQDYADLYFDLYEGKGFLNKVQFNLGIWADLDPHSTQAGTASSNPPKYVNSSSVTVPYWYEFDFLPGMTFTFAKYFTFTPSYYIFTSPSSAFHTFQGLNLNVGIDDSPWLGKFALHPSITYLRELVNKAGDGASQGNYYELGITPSTAFGPVTASIPVTLGLGSGGFYGGNDAFGYVTPGVQFAVPLKFIPAGYGTWTLTTFYKWYYFGADLARFNSQGKNTYPAPEENESVRKASHTTNLFSLGLSATF